MAQNNVITSEYFSGQGLIMFGLHDGVDPDNIGYDHIGNVTSSEIQTSITKVEHRESTSGKRGIDETLRTETKTTMSLTIENFDIENFKKLLQATTTAVAAGTGTIETRKAFVGKTLYTSALNISSVAVYPTGVPGSPWGLGTHYTVNAESGSINIISPSPGGDISDGDLLDIAFDAPAYTQINALDDTDVEFSILFEGLNTMKSDEPVRVLAWRCTLDPLEALALINEEVANANITVNVLYFDAAPTAAKFYMVTKLTPA